MTGQPDGKQQGADYENFHHGSSALDWAVALGRPLSPSGSARAGFLPHLTGVK